MGEGTFSKVYKVTYNNEVVCAKIIKVAINNLNEHEGLIIDREIENLRNTNHALVIKYKGE
jgi:serine/threonine protein kinase